MRILDRSGGTPLPDLSAQTLKELGAWCQESRLRSDSARNGIEQEWQDDLRQYSGIPATTERNVPIDQAPNLEITLGAVAVDGIFANWIELVTQTNQFVTVVPRKKYEEYADALQDLIDWGCREAFNVESAINIAPFDCIQLGSMALYIPWSEKIRKTDVVKVIDRGPRIIPIAIEDFHLPEGSRGDVQNDAWVEMDMWLDSSDLRLYLRREGKDGGWAYLDDDLSQVMRAPNISEVRQRRLDVAREQSSEAAEGTLFNICYRCALYDIDDDGIAEELEIIWDKTSANVLDVRFPQYQLRPFEFAVYQLRAHVAWGLGVQRMCATYEEEVSVLHNERVLNARLANSRLWIADPAIAPFLDRVWTGKVIRGRPDQVVGLQMADIYPSSTQAEMMTVAYAERRTGVSDLQSAGQRLGTRTPATSAMSYMQAANRRFTPSFRNMRNCEARGVNQCVYRYQERVRANDQDAIEDLKNIVGEEKANLLIRLFTTVDNLIDAYEAQLTAVSVSINREADRQSFLMLINLWQNFQKQRVELAQFAAMAPTPQLKALAEAIDEAGLRLLKRFLRTFETISDVDAYLAEVDGFQAMTGGLPPQLQRGLQGFPQQLQELMQQRGPEPPLNPQVAAPPQAAPA